MFRKHISFFNAPRLWKKFPESWWKINQAWQNCIVRVQKDVLRETIWKKLLIIIFHFFRTFSEIFHHRRRNCIPLVQRIFSMELFLKKKCFIKKICVWGQNFSDFLRKIFDGVVKNAFYVSRRTFLTTNLFRKHCSFSSTPRLWTKTFGKLVKKNRQACQNCIVRVQKSVLMETKWKKIMFFIFFGFFRRFFKIDVEIAFRLCRGSFQWNFFWKQVFH